MDLITLADLPELAGADPKPRTQIVIGRLDANLRDPRYGKFAITQAEVDGWKRNLAGVFGGQVSMDFDHSSDRGQGTKAACWITGIAQQGTADGSLITADVEFTKAGAKAVRNGDYKYTSPTFVANYSDEHGHKHGPALIGGALTNRPVLRKGMPTLSLSKDTFEGVATPSSSAKRERKRARKLLASNPEAPRDSRGQMDLSELAKLLDLPADADQITVLAKVASIAPSTGTTQSSTTSTLSAADAAAAAAKQAKKARKLAKKQKGTMALDQEGNVLLDAAGLAELVTAANAGQAAALQLAEQTFDHAWTKALSEGRAAPAQEDTMRALFRKDQEIAIKTLDSFVPIVPVKPTGSGEGPAAEAPLGMDQDRYQLHTEAKTLAAQKMKSDPNLAEADAYTLAAIEIEDRKFTLENPGI